MIELTNSNFKKTINEQDKLIVVDFWASWCGPCRMMEPVLEELDSELPDSVIIGKLNVDGYPDITKSYGIRNIPTMLFFKNGEVVDMVVGALTKNNLKAKIERLLV